MSSGPSVGFCSEAAEKMPARRLAGVGKGHRVGVGESGPLTVEWSPLLRLVAQKSVTTTPQASSMGLHWTVLS